MPEPFLKRSFESLLLFSARPAAWSPAVNAFRCAAGFVLCVELAGVEESHLVLEVEPRRVRIRGCRTAAEPHAAAGPLLKVLAMEIDAGPFERQFTFPDEIEPDDLETEQRNGILWIFLPIRQAVEPVEGEAI